MNGLLIDIIKKMRRISVLVILFSAVSCMTFSKNVISNTNDNKNEYVDLGLSVYWATRNVGAEKPEDIGSYYSWGETVPKKEYTWSTYKYSKNDKGK